MNEDYKFKDEFKQSFKDEAKTKREKPIKNIFDSGFDENLAREIPMDSPVYVKGQVARTVTSEIEISAALSDIIPNVDDTYDLGSASLGWSSVYANTYYDGGTDIAEIYVNVGGDTMTGDLTVPDLIVSSPDEIYDLSHDSFADYDVNEHKNHALISITAGDGLSGGGTIETSKTINVDMLGMEDLIDPDADRILFWDESEGKTDWLTASTDHFTITTTTLTIATDGVDDTLIDWGTGANQVNTSDLPMSQLGSPTYTTAQSFFDNTMSSGYISGGETTDAGGGAVAVAAGKGYIRADNDELSDLKAFDFDADASVTLTDESLNYVYVDYDSGTPSIDATTDVTSLDHTSQFVISLVYREGTDLHITQSGQKLNNFIHDLYYYAWEYDGIQRASGAVTTEDAGTGLALNITAGVFYWALERITTSAVDTSNGDVYSRYYYDGDLPGGADWVLDDNSGSGYTLIDNTYYNDVATGLAELTVNRYGVHWLYMVTDGDIYTVYGQGDYTAAQALAASAPADLPGELAAIGVLIAKVIVQKSAANISSITLPWVSNIGTSSATDHGGLAGLTDDDHTQYLLVGGSRAMSGNLDVGDNNIVNVGDIAVDSITADDGTGPIIINDEIEMQDGEKILLGTGSDGELYSTSDDVYIKNVTQDKDLIFGIDDGGVSKTITWDADVDKLLHSAGTFNFDDDNLTTTGDVTCANLSCSGTGHDGFSDFVANEHIDWTNASDNFATSGTVGTGEITVADGSSINLQEAITFTGATTENLIEIPDTLAAALIITEGANAYMTFTTSDAGEKIELGVKLDMGDNEIEDVKSLAFNDGGATVTQVKDEDNMASDSDTMLATQQSIKAYVDTEVAGVSGAPADAQYVTLAVDGDLSAERVLTAGDAISVTDAGANSTVTVAVSHLGLEDLADPGADRIYFWDDSETKSDWLVPNTGLTISALNLNVSADYSVITANDGGTDVTAAELEELTDGSATVLHSHAGAGTGTLTTIKEGGVQVGDADIVTLDFGAGFDVGEDPDTEVNITLDFSEVAGHDNFTDFVANEHIDWTAGTADNFHTTGIATFGAAINIDDNSGDSPAIRFYGGTNSDSISILLRDDVTVGHEDLEITLADTSGNSKLLIRDSSNADQVTMDSNGNVVMNSLSVNDGNITNVGDVALDSITADDGTGPIIINDEIEMQDGEKILLGTGSDGELYSSSDDVYLKNVTQDKDLILGINDGGASKTITWDADVDQLKHSGGAFNFHDDNLITTGTADFGGTTVDSLSVSDGNITNVGDIALDSITADDGSGPILVNDELEMQDGEKLLLGTGSDGELYSSSDDVYIKNVTQDKDVIFHVNDGGADTEVLRLDADVPKIDVSACDVQLDNTFSIQFKDSGGTARDAITVDGSNNLIIGDGTNFNSVQLKRVCLFRAELSSDQNNITSGTYVTMQLDSEQFDLGSDYNTGTYQFTTPIDGYYFLRACVAYKNIDNNTDINLRIRNETAGTNFAYGQDGASAGQYHMCQCSGVGYIAASKALECQTTHDMGVDTPDLHDAIFNYFEGWIVST